MYKVQPWVSEKAYHEWEKDMEHRQDEALRQNEAFRRFMRRNAAPTSRWRKVVNAVLRYFGW